MIAGAIPVTAGAIAIGILNTRLRAARPDFFSDFLDHVACAALILFDVLW
jgi:hypothetical protein